jgi:predicted nucleotidyltransferase
VPETSLEEILRVLASSGADFVVIGGLALVLHGGDYLTYDVDVAHLRTRSNARSLATALAPFHPRPVDWPEGLPFVWDEETVLRNTVLTLETKIGRIDLLAEPPGAPAFTELKAHAQILDLEGFQVHVASIDDLIAMKRAVGRPKDLAAVVELQTLKTIDGHSDR